MRWFHLVESLCESLVSSYSSAVMSTWQRHKHTENMYTQSPVFDLLNMKALIKSERDVQASK